MMEDLIGYSLENGCFDALATLEITILYVELLMKENKNEVALRVARRVVEVRDRKSSKLSKSAIDAYHLLPILLNRAKRVDEARRALKKQSEERE